MQGQGLTSNQLKLIAMVSMFLDHVGRVLFPQYGIMTLVGRLAFPIFAFMIAEGCRYTRSRKRYFFQLFALALVCQTVYYVASGSWYQNILMTFSLSVLIICAADRYLLKGTAGAALSLIFLLSVTVVLCLVLPFLLKGSDFYIDYGILGVLLPVAVYYAPGKKEKCLTAALMLAALSMDLGGNQWGALAAVLLLALYNGQQGRRKLKHLFYLFYPAHLALIYLVDLLV